MKKLSKNFFIFITTNCTFLFWQLAEILQIRRLKKAQVPAQAYLLHLKLRQALAAHLKKAVVPKST